MTPVSLYPILPVILLALLTMKLISKVCKVTAPEGHFKAIDGLRGYLAFFVFLHHSCIWYYYLHGYGWRPPPSIIYDQFGPTSVCVFFMITAFLFFSKLLQARMEGLDWLRLYISRVLRIMPLYIFAMLLLFIIVGVISNFTLREPLAALLVGMGKWLLFIQTDLNGIRGTWQIMAGVVWSLAFEWMFYFSLPYFGLLFKIRATLATLIISIVGILSFIYVITEFYPMGGISRIYPFFGGILAAFLVRDKRAKELASGPWISALIILFLLLIMTSFPSVYEPIPLLMMTVVFTAIACGNSVFGILTHNLSRAFGQISYSIYLLHGILLFTTYHWILGYRTASSMSVYEHWIATAVCGIMVVVVSSATYLLIELPAQKTAALVYKKIKPSAGY